MPAANTRTDRWHHPEEREEVEILEETPVDDIILNDPQISFNKDLRTNF